MNYSFIGDPLKSGAGSIMKAAPEGDVEYSVIENLK